MKTANKLFLNLGVTGYFLLQSALPAYAAPTAIGGVLCPDGSIASELCKQSAVDLGRLATVAINTVLFVAFIAALIFLIPAHGIING